MIDTTDRQGSVFRRVLPSVLATAAAVGGLLVASGVVPSTGCRQQAIAFEHTSESPEAVARAVLEGLNNRDVAGLEQLAITKHEFRKLVWPKLPAAKPGRNIPWDYVWNDLSSKSVMQLRARLHEWQPTGDGVVVKVEFTGESTDYETFRVRRKSTVIIRTPDGRETRQRLFGSIIEQSGRYKVFSYVVD
jgi:hypothetical protein